MRRILLSITLMASLSSFAQLTGFAVGDNAPQFTGTDLEGGSHDLSAYTAQNKYVLLDLFAYWCGPCLDVAPIMNQFYEKYGCNSGNVVVLGVEYEGTDAQCHEFETNAGLANAAHPTPMIPGVSGGGGTIINAYGVQGFPTICLIGPDGKFISVDVWPVGSVADLEGIFPSGVLTPSSCTVGLEDEDVLANFSVYPNPVVGNEVTVNFAQSSDESFDIEIYDVQGRLVKSISSTNLEKDQKQINLDTTNFTSGVYILTLTTESGKTINKKLNVL